MAQARKQNSGRGSGKRKITRGVVNDKEKCFACNRPGHIVADCRDKKAKDAWIADRKKKKRERAMMTVVAASPIATRRSEATQETGHLIGMKIVIVVVIARAAATGRTENPEVKIPKIPGQETAG